MVVDWENARLIPYERSQQAFDAGEFVGLATAVEKLHALPELIRNTPGFQLCIATIEAAAMTKRGNMSITSMRFAAKNGVDINTHMVASYPDGLRVLPMDLAQLAEIG